MESEDELPRGQRRQVEPPLSSRASAWCLVLGCRSPASVRRGQSLLGHLGHLGHLGRRAADDRSDAAVAGEAGGGTRACCCWLRSLLARPLLIRRCPVILASRRGTGAGHWRRLRRTCPGRRGSSRMRRRLLWLDATEGRAGCRRCFHCPSCLYETGLRNKRRRPFVHHCHAFSSGPAVLGKR